MMVWKVKLKKYMIILQDINKIYTRSTKIYLILSKLAKFKLVDDHRIKLILILSMVNVEIFLNLRSSSTICSYSVLFGLILQNIYCFFITQQWYPYFCKSDNKYSDVLNLFLMNLNFNLFCLRKEFILMEFVTYIILHCQPRAVFLIIFIHFYIL